MNYRGWMFIGFSDEYPSGKIKPRTFMNEECLVFRTETGNLEVVEPYCSHFGVNMKTGRVVKECIQCPMHGRVFRGDGRGANSRHRPIRSYPVAENRGLAFAYFDHAGVAPQWEAPQFLDEATFPDILWRHARMLELHHPSVPLDNSVDPRHFLFTHSMFGKHIAEGEFTPNGHKALGTMATQLTKPLSYVSGTRAAVTTHFDGPLNTYLRADVGRSASDLCNFLTIIEGKKCLLTQIGIGRRSRNPLRLAEHAVGMMASWFATYEDAPVWNNRKPQEPDNDPHGTDRALADFRTWFEGFAYEPAPSSGGERLIGTADLLRAPAAAE
ncbi:MAG: Rieske 2Fe-2S domain-containing protein [Myxococcales bacterium]|nr:Rieske 2Fe-2S domain-containing protein [Myxococcales bacterium]